MVLITKETLFSFNNNKSKRVLQHKLFSTVNSRNFILFLLVTVLWLSVIVVFIHGVFLVLKWIKWVLSRLNDSKLTLNHAFSCTNTCLSSVWKISRFGFVTKTLVSPAKKLVMNFCLEIEVHTSKKALSKDGSLWDNFGHFTPLWIDLLTTI
jgi:hypothetical protein